MSKTNYRKPGDTYRIREGSFKALIWFDRIGSDSTEIWYYTISLHEQFLTGHWATSYLEARSMVPLKGSAVKITPRDYNVFKKYLEL